MCVDGFGTSSIIDCVDGLLMLAHVGIFHPAYWDDTVSEMDFLAWFHIKRFRSVCREEIKPVLSARIKT